MNLSSLSAIAALVISGLLTLSNPVAAQSEPVLSAEIKETAASLRDSAMEGTRAYEILESLTTEVGPRLAGTEAEARARAWGEVKFKALGFDSVRTETFEMDGWERRAESAVVTAPYPQPLAVTALGGSVSTPEGGIEAEIVAFKDFAALASSDADLTGKIAYIANRMERGITGRGYGMAGVARRAGAIEAGKRGASALIIRSIGTDDHRNPHTGSMSYAEDVARIPAAAISNPDADQIDRMVVRGAPVRVRLNLQTSHPGTVTSGNVIGEITGRDAPHEVVLIACHLDSWDLGTGAIDDGSGCAIVMEAARRISELPQRPRRTIRVVLFGAEERGLIGARAYLKAHKDTDLKDHILVTESDFGADRVWMLSPGVSAEALPVMQQVGDFSHHCTSSWVRTPATVAPM